MRARLQKIIAGAGLMSRRAAEELIAAGRVTVNGAPATLGARADAERDEICVDGHALRASEEKLTIMLHKPRGVVTTMSDEKGRKTVRELLGEIGTRVYPVGRLDMDSEGLLLMTNDGALAYALTHPSREIDKCYFTWVKGVTEREEWRGLARPMRIDGYLIRPAEVRLLKREGADAALLSITIHEGRNRQIRKMCQSQGLRVTRLLRVREGPLQLGELPAGQWRKLSEEELQALRDLHT